MDYKRIYAEFIKDRRGKESGLTGYLERHHIIPRCLGGGDEPTNLIALSFEDHFFAHLLLACIHGGKLASALWMMVNSSGAQWSSRHRARRAYAAAERHASKVMSDAWQGSGNPLFNAKVFDWTNYRTGEQCFATLHRMHEKIGGSRPHWTNVARGNRPSYRGWVMSANVSAHARSEKGHPFNFVNRDGREFFGTQGAFAAQSGVNLASASRIVRHESVSECGWRLATTADRPANWAKDGLPSRKRRAALSAI